MGTKMGHLQLPCYHPASSSHIYTLGAVMLAYVLMVHHSGGDFADGISGVAIPNS
ncbi:hypothetical protein K503DRAFT_302035 [Rhizopogon vinicolor AM-OR11-026]|uniref:Uncharacterized protein n=1 Tax=Rhizopogon vinicolor AM-OR11-026 TaxID=1314800 RepID=A0A1B7MUY0_9AGAM|nr:hypothetical protein K503DRAFT_302035 [Rhizopogon vinicolor AM-OR11-026]